MKTKGLTFVMFILLSMSSFAQESGKRFAFELNGGASFATKKIEGSSLDPGFGFEGIFHYRFIQHLGVYGGWGWNRFGADNSFAGNDVCFEETGYIIGLNFKHPIGTSRLSSYFRAGALYNHIETENSDGDIVNDTKHGWGYQLACGLDFDLGKNWSLLTGLKFNSLSRETTYEADPVQINYQYLSVRIGIMKSF
jgi:opacity protein-like surface antigen